MSSNEESHRYWRIPTQRSLVEYVVPERKPPVSAKRTEIKDEPVKKGVRKEKKPTALKKKILTEGASHVPKEVELTENDVRVLELLKTLKGNFDAKYAKNQLKAHAHRVMVCGMHETLKHLKASNIICVFVARNIDDVVVEGEASTLFQNLTSECDKQRIPIVYACTKKSLSKAVNKFPYTNVIGLMRANGQEDNLASIIECSRHGHIVVDKPQNNNPSLPSLFMDQSSLFP